MVVVDIVCASAVCTDSLLYRWSVQLTRHTFLGYVIANKHGPSALNTPLKCSMVTWRKKGLFFFVCRSTRLNQWYARIQWRGIGYFAKIRRDRLSSKRGRIGRTETLGWTQPADDNCCAPFKIFTTPERSNFSRFEPYHPRYKPCIEGI